MAGLDATRTGAVRGGWVECQQRGSRGSARQHNFTPFLDARPGVDPTERFKALAGSEQSGLMAFVSSDGLRWRGYGNGPVLTVASSTPRTSRSGPRPRGPTCAISAPGPAKAIRLSSRQSCDVPDFLNWSEPVEMTLGNGPPAIYTPDQPLLSVMTYVSIGARFFPVGVSCRQPNRGAGRAPLRIGCSDAVLMTTWRRGLRPDLRGGVPASRYRARELDSRSNFPALGLVQTGPEEMSLFVNQNYAQPTAELRRYSMRLDGLASFGPRGRRSG